MSNIVIIGSGPAGVSAALYTARAGVDTTVLTRGPGALDRAELIQNYYGFAAPISGAELERQGIEGAKAVGVKFVTTEAVGLTYTDKLTVETLDGDAIINIRTTSLYKDMPIDGLRVQTEQGWFVARPSGTEDLYKIYGESYKGDKGLIALLTAGEEIVTSALSDEV